ncbi:hypothetical protein BJ508DRAFT_140752 [Ascobolus immersus RN42]|uniref:Fungal N-terminal domain-containing protein n=1 Tax=Ascobolus immersus RN42 TaxID=1160509 RepID=A0A3N4ICT4_ASCIM|nr:hypothetical protein BJ508DRAFT_140752 [Ascobolus immersus RN42]
MALIGDFIAVGELAAKLYNQYYRISRKAPKELSDLSKEIQTLTSAIGFMREEVKDENSIIRQAGDERTKLLATVEGQILEVLQDLDKVWKKYNDRMADAGKSRMKTAFAGLGFMNKVPDLDRYRAKLVHHNATLSLLLTSIGK